MAPVLKSRIYLETTIASYLTARPTRDVVMWARQEITQIWWERRLGAFTPVISQLVLDEAGQGDTLAAERRLALLTGFPLLALDNNVARLARRLVRPGALPVKAAADAVHIALCSVHQVPYLVTWNFRHIANAATRRRLQGICAGAGFDFPVICTPDQLMGGDR